MKNFRLGLFAFTALTALCVFAPFKVYAEDNAATIEDGGGAGGGSSDSSKQAEAPSSTDDSDKIEDPEIKAKSKALNSKYVSVLSNLNTQEAQHFAILVVNQNLIGTVKAVEADIALAVKGCADNNKEMAGTVNNRFAAWKEAVKAPMQEAQANIDNMILAQSYLPKEEFESLFGLIEEVREYNSSRFEKTPVTTPEACEFMLSKMDETEKNMTGMLRATLASYPSAQQKNQE